MKIFLDTSSLFKLYHEEDGTEELEKIFSQVKITEIFFQKLLKLNLPQPFGKRLEQKKLQQNKQI